MAQNTHYHVLRDGPVELGLARTTLELDWDPSNDIVLNDFRLSPVLSYRADPTPGAQEIEVTVHMRNQSGRTLRVTGATSKLTGTTPSTIFEVLPRDEINNEGMKFIFTVERGHGTLFLSDVIVWFHRNQ